MTCGPGPPCQRSDDWLRRRREGVLPRDGSMLPMRWFAFLTVSHGEDEGGAQPRGGSTLLVRWFAFFALEDQRASCMTCGTGPPCHGMDTPVCIGGGFSRRFEAGAGESSFKEGFIPRVAAMPCFSPTRGVLSPPSSPRPFAFKVSASRCRSHHGLARPLRALPARGGTQLGAQPARMGCAGICREDLCWCLSSRRPCCQSVCVLCFQTP
jgi:hypothetical protein